MSFLSVPRHIVFLGAVGVLATAAFVFMPRARAAPPFALTTVACDGSACGGGASEQYHYDITPGSQGCSSFDVGFHGNYTITNVVMPTGWSYAIVNPVAWKDSFPMTSHGGTSPGSSGGCTYKMHWSGPSQTSPFVIAYDHSHDGTPSNPHDVHWIASDSGRANWSTAVGISTGPIHSPVPYSVPPP